MALTEKSYSQWNCPHYVWDSITHFKIGWKKQHGIHTVKFPAPQSEIEFYVNEHCSRDDTRVQPIFFNAALSKRKEKKGPYFTGVGMSSRNQLPLICFSDPTLDLDNEINLAWYTGYTNSNFTNNLDRIITLISDESQREPLLIGGSGGGFAALSTAIRLQITSSAFVWNPQTDIFNYAKGPVQKYLKTAHNIGNASLSRIDWIDYCRIRTDKVAKTSILDPNLPARTRRVLYLQNASDWHKSSHLQPLWNVIADSKLLETNNIFDENHIFNVTNFSLGHKPPKETVISNIIDQLMNIESTISEIVI